MNSSNLSTTIKENIRVVNLAVFAISLICLLLPFYTASAFGYGYSISGFQSLGSIWGILLLAAPAFLGVYLFVLSKGKSVKEHAMYLGAANAGGLLFIILFALMAGGGSYSAYGMTISAGLGFGAILSLLVYAAGAAANGMVYFGK